MKQKKYLILYFLVPFIVLFLVKYGLKNGQKEYQPLSLMGGDAKSLRDKLPDKIDYVFDVKPILSDRCYLCHGPDEGTREGGLRLDTKEGAYAAIGEHLDAYAIVPGNIKESRLVDRINTTDQTKIMPPTESNLSLSDYEKRILTKWIKQGAIWKDHWSFVPPEKKELPIIHNTDWVSNNIDYFVLNKLESKDILPSPKASKEKLIRKVYFDLIGLPPSIEALDTFLKDSAPNAFEKVVDQLLASKQYGEHMASNWLDIARYADTHGYQDDLERVMWPWRDWVIHAFNKNMPYNTFIQWQLAGDLLPNATLEQIVATGFNRNHKITQEGGVIPEEYRVEYVMDRTNTTAKSLLGLTMECARCHDHKYDPISQKEFYKLYGFFNKVDEKGRIGYKETPEPFIKISQQEINESLQFIQMPDSIPEIQLMVMSDGASERKTHVLNRGVYDAPTEEVSPGTPKAILPFPQDLELNRLGLTNWLFDEKNPLTARVAVNRLWQQIFGSGIVKTSDDFGNQGDLPSHPDLLDWLAVTYRNEGWDTKKMIKRMVLSSTYQQTSKINSELLEIDPENILLARSSRLKLSAEMIRDNALFVSGLLVDKIGGPSVKPYQPSGLWAETTSGRGLTKYIVGKGEDKYRRSLYTFWKRTSPPPSMITFDAAARDFCEVKRQKTSTPLQALVMLNDPQLIEAAQTLALQMLEENTLTDSDRIRTIFRKITSRIPSEIEIIKLLEYLEKSKKDVDETTLKKLDLLIKGKDIKPNDLQAYTVLTSLVFNLDESIIKG